MRSLITGAQGFVGRYLTAELLNESAGSEVLGIGRSDQLDGLFSHFLSVERSRRAKLPPALYAALDQRYRYVQASILDEQTISRLTREFQPDCIFHLASGLRDDNNQKLITTNVQGTTALITAIAASNVSKPTVILGSSGGVYGSFNLAALPLKESTPCNPADVYSVTKLAAEQIGRVLGRYYNIPVLVARIFNIVGPGQDERHVCGRFVTQLETLGKVGQTSLPVGNLGTTRDFIDVRDVARALVLLSHHGKPSCVYNVGSGKETSVRSILELLIRYSGFHGEVHEIPENSRQSDVPRHWADIRLLKDLGFVPQHPLQNSLIDLLSYYRES